MARFHESLRTAIGVEACLQRVQCFATDVDKAVLRQSRCGIYSSSEVRGIPPELLEKYFEPTEKGYVFHRKLQARVTFTCHDLTQHPPIPNIDLLMCRNVLIYFNPDVQASILAAFTSPSEIQVFSSWASRNADNLQANFYRSQSEAKILRQNTRARTE